MDRFLEMQTFATVVEAGSFVRAADVLGLSKAATSRHVADLEARLGVRLLHRTTRRLSLTAEGEIFLARCRELLEQLSEAEGEITSRSAEAIGRLKLNVPVSFGVLHLAHLWPGFLVRHPGVSLDVTLNDRTVDLVEEGYDLAVRIGSLPDSSLVTRQISSTRLVLCASPGYLRDKGAPAHPSELARHAVIGYRLLSTRDVWSFEGPEGTVRVEVTPRMLTNSGDTCRAAALQHLGLVLQPSFLVGSDLREGTLVEVLPQYRAPEYGVYAVYPTRKHVSPKVRLLIDYLAAAFRTRDWPD